MFGWYVLSIIDPVVVGLARVVALLDTTAPNVVIHIIIVLLHLVEKS